MAFERPGLTSFIGGRDSNGDEPRAKRPRIYGVFKYPNLPEPKTAQGLAVGRPPNPQPNIAGCGFSHYAQPTPEEWVESRWRLVDPEGSNPEVHPFKWTPDLIATFADRYRARAQKCDYQIGVQNAAARAEDMARLQMDWENQAMLAPLVDPAPTALEQLSQMRDEFARAEEERASRFESARLSATRLVGHTPVDFQAPNAPIEAHVDPPTYYPRPPGAFSYGRFDA